MLIAGVLVAGCLVALASGKIPPVLVFATTLSAAGLLGIAPSSELLSGLSSPAVVTVAAMLIIAAGVVHTGIVSRAGRRILGDASTLRGALTRLLYPIGFASSFMNNTPIIAMTIPAAQEFEQTSGIAARRLLMPVAFAAAMGGATTLVGTSSNLLIASLAGAEGIELGFFAFTPVALPTFFVGVGLLILIVRKVLRREEMTSDNTRRWRVELHVGAGALLQGNTLAEGGLLSARDYEATSVVRGTETVAQTNPLDAGDVITYEANANGVRQLWANPRFGQKNQRLYQVTLGTGASGNLGQLGHHNNLNILAALDSMGELSAATARPGEVLYVTSSSVQALESVEDIAMVTDVGDRAPQVAKTRLALGILAAVIATLAWGKFPTEWVAATGALAIIFCRIISARAAFRALNWNLLGVLAGSVGLGSIVVSSGIAEAIADWVVSTTGSSSVTLVLIVGVVSLLLAVFVTTTAAVSIVVPIIVYVSNSLAVSPGPLLALLAVSACLSFVNPYSNQSFMMVMGAGNYDFRDYLRLGAPVAGLTLITASLACLFWLAH